MIGKSLAHYKITDLLGKGGMGEVYRARDTKLERDVAIKVLPPELASDPERSARFDREARTLASLQHPNVASIYGFEEIEGTRFLVMELVEGEDLSVRLEKGTLHLDETLRIARDIATGMEAAHEQGIVHRDLKPANIMLTPSGEAKILDFGLARAWFGEGENTSDMEHSPTITNAMTMAGTVLGTAAYMSPEQARGGHVDRRADIWAFGTILWEMVTGKRLFQGQTVSDTLAAVLRDEPDWSQLPVEEAPQLCRIIERCLVRDPKLRLRDIGEARVLLQKAGGESSLVSFTTAGSLPEAEATASTGNSRSGWLAALAMTAVALLFAILFFSRDSNPPLSQTTLGLNGPATISLVGENAWASLSFSPDGETIAYVGGFTGDLYVRSLNAFESTKIANTEGARLPSFSPDGNWIAYAADSRIWKVAVSGGAPLELCSSPIGPGLAWGDGEIYFCRGMGGGLWAVPESGGEPRQISELNPSREETSHRWPHVLPGGKHLLLTIKTADIATFDDALIGLLSLEDGSVSILATGGSDPHYIASGHILYGRGYQLFTLPFDLTSLSVSGTPTPVLDNVHTSPLTGHTYYTVGTDGRLAYVPNIEDMWDFQLVWIDMAGRVEPVDFEENRGFEGHCVSRREKISG